MAVEKYYATKQLFKDSISNISSNGEKWSNFLDCASRFYKYRFADQVLIHAQRPDATACASYDLWNNTFSRYIAKGSRGIALLTHGFEKGTTKLRYVFDVSDTRRKDRQHDAGVRLWRFNEERHTDLLRGEPGIDNSSAEDIIRKTVSDSLENLDLILSDSGRNIALRSAAYMVLQRCGIKDSLFDSTPGYFDDITTLSDAELDFVGSNISYISEEVLRSI